MASSVIKNTAGMVREITFNYTISANSTYNTNLKTLIDNDLPSGYRFGGIAGYTSNSVQVLTTNIGYYDSPYSLQLANRGGSSISSTLYRVFYLAVPN